MTNLRLIGVAGNMQYLIIGKWRVGVKLFNGSRGSTESRGGCGEEKWKAGMEKMLRFKEKRLLSALARGWWWHPQGQHYPSPHHNIWPRASGHLLLLLFPNILLYTGHSWREARNDRAFRKRSFCKDFHYASALGHHGGGISWLSRPAQLTGWHKSITYKIAKKNFLF